MGYVGGGGRCSTSIHLPCRRRHSDVNACGASWRKSVRPESAVLSASNPREVPRLPLVCDYGQCLQRPQSGARAAQCRSAGGSIKCFLRRQCLRSRARATGSDRRGGGPRRLLRRRSAGTCTGIRDGKQGMKGPARYRKPQFSSAGFFVAYPIKKLEPGADFKISATNSLTFAGRTRRHSCEVASARPTSTTTGTTI